MTSPSRRSPGRRFRIAVLLAATGIAPTAFAYPGEQLLNFGSNYIIAPLGIFSVVIALAGSFFDSRLVKGAVYAAIICVVLFFIIKMAPQLMTAMRS